MSARPTPPSSFEAVRQIVDLGWRQAIRSKLLIGAGITLAVAAGLAMLIRSQTDDDPAGLFQAYVLMALTTVFVPILALLLGTHAMASEREGGTLPFLFTRPVPRAAVVLGKGIAAILLATAASVLAVVLSYVANGFPTGAQLLGACAGIAFTAAALTAFFVLLGTIMQRSLYAGLAYIALYEGVLGTVVTGRAGASITWHGRALLTAWAGDELPFELSRLFEGNALTSLVALVLVIVGALALAAAWAEKREYGMREKAKEE